MLVVAPVSSSLAQGPQADLIEYATQSVCIDEAGKATSALPIDPDCVRSRPQRADDIASYRKHDWPNSLAAANQLLGYQASDSVLDRRGSRTWIVETFDLGTDGQTFGRSDGGRGDGGQVLLFVGDWASFAMTEDGGGGVQWFIGETCRSAVDQDARFLSSLVFRQGLAGQAWQATVAKLNITADPATCPARFNDGYTQYRLDQLEIPFQVIDAAPTARPVRRVLSVVVSEHYGGRDIETAEYLERSTFAKGLGLVRWERWAMGNRRNRLRVQSCRKPTTSLTTLSACELLGSNGPAPTPGRVSPEASAAPVPQSRRVRRSSFYRAKCRIGAL
jgi:hypothetical protein